MNSHIVPPPSSWAFLGSTKRFLSEGVVRSMGHAEHSRIVRVLRGRAGLQQFGEPAGVSVSIMIAGGV